MEGIKVKSREKFQNCAQVKERRKGQRERGRKEYRDPWTITQSPQWYHLAKLHHNEDIGVTHSRSTENICVTIRTFPVPPS